MFSPGEVLLRNYVDREVENFQEGVFAGSNVPKGLPVSRYICKTPGLTSSVFNIRYNSSTVGTITFEAGSLTGTESGVNHGSGRSPGIWEFVVGNTIDPILADVELTFCEYAKIV